MPSDTPISDDGELHVTTTEPGAANDLYARGYWYGIEAWRATCSCGWKSATSFGRDAKTRAMNAAFVHRVAKLAPALW